MDITFLHSINDILPTQWQAIFADKYPFTQHAFLASLETSGCVQQSTGWQPQHILVHEGDKLIAAMPCYIKTHSYGEYVFDWAWANAYHQHGLNYYPKLLAAIPFTPATGPRLMFDESMQSDEQKISVIKAIGQALRDKFGPQGLSSWHLLFPTAELSSLLIDCGWQQRVGIQYHWFNKDYASFDEFLARFKSRKRKTLRKEREAIVRQDISMQVIVGVDLDDEMMTEFYRFYHLTYLKRSGQHGYLNLKFFHLLLASMKDKLVMICAKKNGSLIGAALCFRDDNTLYGRYWGCEQEYEFLHFEACYYQGIEFCINTGLRRFDPGAQGEHKIARGFEPVKTLSNHVIMQADFSYAIEQFINDEKTQVDVQLAHLKTLLPFKTEPV
ncbi:MAG: GNAT family N-acetyltransferase [Cycloclasticus sp.]